MTFGWVVGHPPWNSQNEHPYQLPIFNFQLLRNNDQKQIHQDKYWLGNFFGNPDPIPFFRVGPKKAVCFNNRVESRTPSVQGRTQHTRFRSWIDVPLGITF